MKLRKGQDCLSRIMQGLIPKDINMQHLELIFL